MNYAGHVTRDYASKRVIREVSAGSGWWGRVDNIEGWGAIIIANLSDYTRIIVDANPRNDFDDTDDDGVPDNFENGGVAKLVDADPNVADSLLKFVTDTTDLYHGLNMLERWSAEQQNNRMQNIRTDSTAPRALYITTRIIYSITDNTISPIIVDQILYGTYAPSTMVNLDVTSPYGWSNMTFVRYTGYQGRIRYPTQRLTFMLMAAVNTTITADWIYSP
jgi:hypothetical protein